jgi:hypothetical protein
MPRPEGLAGNCLEQGAHGSATWRDCRGRSRQRLTRDREVLPRFVDDFYRPDFGVIYPRRERKQQLALAVGMETVEFADYRTERPRGCLEDIEVREQHDAIAGDIEDSAADALAVCGWNQRAEERFEEVKPD